MVAVATERKLAWIVLAILGCTALIGFGNGLKSAMAAPRASLPGETSAGAFATGAAPRDATAATPLDEARVHEIAREEADAALARARPLAAAPKKAKAAASAADSATPDQPVPYAAPSSGDGAAPPNPPDASGPPASG